MHNICTNRWLKFRIPGNQRPSLSTCEPILPNPPHRTLIFQQIIDFEYIIPLASFFSLINSREVRFHSNRPHFPPLKSLSGCHAVESLKFNREHLTVYIFLLFSIDRLSRYVRIMSQSVEKCNIVSKSG